MNSDQDRALHSMAMLLVYGALTTLGGFGLAAAMSGASTGAYLFGMVVGGVGGTCLWVALVAYGVALGMRASHVRPS